MKEKLAIISVVYENYEATQDFIDALEKQQNKNFHLYLADLSQNKKPIKSRLLITVLESVNKGYAYGINLGLKKAVACGIEYFCVINNDVFFKSDFVEKTLSSILAHSNGIVGGKIYYAPGYEYHKSKYQKTDLGKVIWYAGGRIDWNHVVTPHFGVDEVDHGQYDKPREIDFITGCLMCLDKKVIDKIGFFDESYFLYYEDADFCVRAKKSKLNLVYDPSLVIWHKNAQSTDGAGSSFHQKYQQKNRLKFGLKFAPLRTKFHLLKNLFNKSL